MTRIKFKEILSLKDYINLLIKEKENISYNYIKNKTRVEIGDYLEACPLALISIDQINQEIREYEEKGLSCIDNIMYSTKLRLKNLIEERNSILSEFKTKASSIHFQHTLKDKKDIRKVEVSFDYLGFEVKEIWYKPYYEKDMLKICIVFCNDSIRVLSIHLDRLVRIVKSNF